MKQTSTFKVGKYTCEMSWSPEGGLKAEWDPHLPPNRSLSKKELREYQAGRAALMQQIAETLHVNILVVDT